MTHSRTAYTYFLRNHLIGWIAKRLILTSSGPYIIISSDQAVSTSEFIADPTGHPAVEAFLYMYHFNGGDPGTSDFFYVLELNSHPQPAISLPQFA